MSRVTKDRPCGTLAVALNGETVLTSLFTIAEPCPCLHCAIGYGNPSSQMLRVLAKSAYCATSQAIPTRHGLQSSLSRKFGSRKPANLKLLNRGGQQHHLTS